MTDIDARPVVARNISKSYGNFRALDGVEFVLTQGEAVGIVGRNGAGKTTFLDILSGLLRSETGSALIFGSAPTSARASRFRARQFETPVTYAHLRPTQLPRALGFDRTMADRLSEFYQRLAVPNQRCQALSKGELLRLGLATAFARAPALLLLDEPTAGLDPLAVEDLEFMCREYQSGGGSLLLATHRLEDLRSTTQRTVLFDDGRVMYDGETASFLQTAVRIAMPHVPAWLTNGYLASSRHLLVHHDAVSETEIVTQDPQALIEILENSPDQSQYSVQPSLASAVRRAVLAGQKGGS